MKKIGMKKITALVLVACLIMGVVVNSDIIKNYASGERAGVTEPDVAVNVHYASGDPTHIVLWWEQPDELPAADDWSARPPRVTGGVYVNGELNENCVLIKFPDRYHIALVDGGVNAVPGTTVVFDGVYSNYEGTYFARFNRVAFKYTEAGWKEIIEEETDPDVKVNTTVNVRLSGGDTPYITMMWEQPDELPAADNWSAQPKRVSGGVYVNGELNAKCDLIKFPDHYHIALDGGGVNAVPGTTVVFDGVYSNDTGDYAVKFNKITFEYTADGWRQLDETDIVPSVKVNPYISGGDVNGIGIWTDLSDTLPTVNGWCVQKRVAGGIYVNGILKTECPFIKIADKTYRIGLDSIKDDVEIVEGTTVVLDGIYGSSDNPVKFNRAEFQCIDGAFRQIITVDAIVDPEGSGETNGIYIYTNVPDIFAVSENVWDKRLNIYSGGIYVDGEKNDLCTQLIKLEAKENYSQYYIDTWNIKDSIKDGTKVVIEGVFGETENGQTMQLKVNKATFVYNESTKKWMQVTNGDLGTTEVFGDANANKAFDVIDLVRMLRYTTADVDEINLTDADLNKDSHVDEQDVQIAKEILVGKTIFKNGYNITGKPTYDGTEKISIGAYCGPRRGTEENQVDWRTDTEFARYAAAGFNTVIAEKDVAYGKNYDESGNASAVKNFVGSDLDTYMGLAAKYGIDVIVESQVLNNVLTGKATLENAGAEVTTMLSALKDRNNFKGILLADEPGIGQISNYRAVSEFIRTKAAMQGKTMFTSLIPYHMGYSVFEAGYGKGNDLDSKYRGYLNEFGSCLGLINPDIYPFGADSMLQNYFKNLEMTAAVAKGTADSGLTIQSFAAKSSDDTMILREMNSKEYYTYQMYSALAYGMKNITYFTYWQHWGAIQEDEIHYNSLIDAEGAVNEPVYNAVKAANEEIRKFDQVYMDFAWQGTMKATGRDSDGLLAQMPEYLNARINSFTATEDTIMGCLKDSKGYDGFMLVNATDPEDKYTSKVSIIFKDAQKAIVYVAGEVQEVELTNGAYTAELAPGAGVFVIPFTGEEKAAEGN